MKKLMCLLLLTVLIVGCSNNDSKSRANNEGKLADNQTTNDTKKDDEKTEKEDQKDSEKEDKEKSKENTDTDSSETTSQSSNKQSSDTSSQTSDKKEQDGSNNSSNGNSQSAPNQKPSQPEPAPEPTPIPTPTPVPNTPTEQRAKADGVMAQINAYRQQNGLSPFIVTEYLLTNSSNHAYAMAEARALWHSGAAECITNYDDPFSAWVNSPEHNKKLLNNNRYGAVSIYYVDEYYFSVFQTSP